MCGAGEADQISGWFWERNRGGKASYQMHWNENNGTNVRRTGRAGSCRPYERARQPKTEEKIKRATGLKEERKLKGSFYSTFINFAPRKNQIYREHKHYVCNIYVVHCNHRRI